LGLGIELELAFSCNCLGVGGGPDFTKAVKASTDNRSHFAGSTEGRVGENGCVRPYIGHCSVINLACFVVLYF